MSVICIRGVIHNFSKLIAIHRQHRNLYGTINNTGRDRLYMVTKVIQPFEAEIPRYSSSGSH